MYLKAFNIYERQKNNVPSVVHIVTMLTISLIHRDVDSL